MLPRSAAPLDTASERFRLKAFCAAGITLSLALGSLSFAMPGGTQAAVGQPPAQPPGTEDPEQLRLEEKLKDLQRQEFATQDPREKVRLLTDIVKLCIDLGRDCSTYDTRR